MPCGKFTSTNQKHYPDLGSDASSVWNFCARFSDVISLANQWWRRQMSAIFSGYNRCGSRISRRGCQLTEKVSPLQELPQNKVMYKTFSASAQPKGTPYWICPLGMVDELTLCIIKSKLVTEMTRRCNPLIHWTTHNSKGGGSELSLALLAGGDYVILL